MCIKYLCLSRRRLVVFLLRFVVVFFLHVRFRTTHAGDDGDNDRHTLLVHSTLSPPNRPKSSRYVNDTHRTTTAFPEPRDDTSPPYTIVRRPVFIIFSIYISLPRPSELPLSAVHTYRLLDTRLYIYNYVPTYHVRTRARDEFLNVYPVVSLPVHTRYAQRARQKYP